MRSALVSLAIFLLPLQLLAAISSHPDLIASMEAGVICAPEVVDLRVAPDTVSGTTNVIDSDPPFVSNTNRVPAVLGIGFGVKAMAADPAGIGEVLMVVTHPPMGDQGATRQSFMSRVNGTETSLIFYQFDYGYELLPGTWTMTAFAGKVVIYEATFEVVPPRMVPELAEVCGFQNLLS